MFFKRGPGADGNTVVTGGVNDEDLFWVIAHLENDGNMVVCTLSKGASDHSSSTAGIEKQNITSVSLLHKLLFTDVI